MYNAENTIINALNSIKAQTVGVQEFEVIVVNDGSYDQSEKLVREYMENHQEMNIRILNQPNGGVSKARNTGLKVAEGDYIALLDADDEWLPEKTEKQLKFLQNDLLHVDFITALRNGEKIWFPYQVEQYNLAEMNLRKLLLRVDGQTSTAIFKRKIIENTGWFDENQKYSEDANYWMRVSKSNNMYILAEELAFTGGGKRSFGISGLSANLQEMEKGIQKNLREMYDTKRISYPEYILFFLFSKIKYGIRIVKNKL